MNRKTATAAPEEATTENEVATVSADAPAKRRPGRPKGSTKAATEAARASKGLEPGKRQQRKSRTTAPLDTAAETAKIIEAALKSRGAHGAMQDDLQTIMDWARGVRTEGDALKDFAGRPRRQKAESYPERIARYEMNRALLDGVLAGAVVLDVQNGALRFLHANQPAPSPEPSAPASPLSTE